MSQTTCADSFEAHYPLSRLSTFGIGGPARYFVAVYTLCMLREVLLYCARAQLPYFILGKGSNVLFDDRGFNGIVIANRLQSLRLLRDDQWEVGAGYSFARLGQQTARQGLAGLEFAAGIPGSVGGALFMNAGANGCETGQVVTAVDVLSPDGRLTRWPREALAFGYRYSSFQQMKGVITGAVFHLHRDSTASQRQRDIVQYRLRTQPYGEKSAGCIFRNPIGGHAGALIEKSGLKGYCIGEAQVSSLHANFVVNRSKASAQDVLTLITYLKREVQARTGIALTPEVQIVPYEGVSLL